MLFNEFYSKLVMNFTIHNILYYVLNNEMRVTILILIAVKINTFQLILKGLYYFTNTRKRF